MRRFCSCCPRGHFLTRERAYEVGHDVHAHNSSGSRPVDRVPVDGGTALRSRHRRRLGDHFHGQQRLPAGTLTVSVGTTVSWENDEDPNATNATNVIHDIIADDDSFDSPDYLVPGDTFSLMFTTVGTFHYVCDVHNGMEGWITVQ